MDNTKILICEDDEKFQDVLTQVLETAGFKVLQSSDGREGIDKAKNLKPDLMLLDLNLPDIDGLQVCKILKSGEDTKHIPLIMLTVKSTHSEIIQGLEWGADDYIVKPIVPGILLARINAVIRRSATDDSNENILRAGKIVLDLEKRSCFIDKKNIHLLPKEFEILVILMQKKGKVYSRNYLLQTIWGYEYFGTTRTLDTTIGRLRKKLGPEKDRIETIQTIGYRFVDI